MANKKKTADVAAASAASPVKEKATKSSAAKQLEDKNSAAKKVPCKTSVCVEMSGLSVSVADIQNAVKKAVKDKGLAVSDLKIYVNAAEQAAYYTVDGDGGEGFRIDLNQL